MSLEALIQTVGYPFVFLFIMGESAGVPIPGETAVLIVSAAAGAGRGFNIWLVVVVASAGAIAGGMLGYWIGRRGGRALLERLSGKLWFRKDHIESAERFFSRHGGKTVFFGRSVSYLRVLTALMAGVSRMHYPRFLFYNALGGIVWAAVVSFIGYKFGRHLPLAERIIGRIGWGMLVAAACIAVGYYVYVKFGRLRLRSRRKTGDG